MSQFAGRGCPVVRAVWSFPCGRRAPVYRDGMKWGPWLENTRQNPREALEAELSVMVAGLVIAFVGGSATFAGFVNRGGATSPQPLWGTVIFVVGLLFILLGLSLAVVNLVVYVSSRHRKG